MYLSENEKIHLIDKNEGLLVSIAKRYYTKNPAIDFEDLLQEAKLAYLECVERAENIEQVVSFVDKAVRDKLRKYISANSTITIPTRTYYRMNEEKKKQYWGTLYTSDIHEAGVYTLDFPDIKISISDTISKMPPKHKQIIALRLRGYKQREIASILGETSLQIKKKTYIIRNKIRHALKECA